MPEHGPCKNTDREIWRGPDEGNGAFYADSIHVTEGGGIGINCGGHVIVKPLREWHALAKAQQQSWDAPTNRSYEPVERRAAEIYATYEYNPNSQKPPWIPGGNSTRQDMARDTAREEFREREPGGSPR
jgi:hypothetical protein